MTLNLIETNIAPNHNEFHLTYSNSMLDSILILISRRLPFVLIGIFIFRTGYLVISGLDLIGDESYYWDWSRRLDWCYYSKPPMVAWLIALSTAIGGNNEIAVRLPAVILGTVALYYLYAAAREFYSVKAGALAVLLMLATPFNVLANFLMTIDAPLSCFWVMSLYYLRKALFDNSLYAWLWAGIATGAALLSKQVALLIPLMLVVFLIIQPNRRRWFRHGLLLYAFPVIISLIPIVWWNQQHDWVMFGHSKSHFGINTPMAQASRFQDTAAFSVYQLLLVTPIIYGLILWTTLKKTVYFPRLRPEDQFLLLMGPVLLLGILALSLLQQVQGNWSMPFYFSGIILLSGQYTDGKWKKPLTMGAALGYLMVSLTYALPVTIKILKLQNTPLDPISRFRSWHELAGSVETIREKMRTGNEEIALITLGHRFLTSEMAFYLPDHPRVYRFEGSGGVTSQYELWDSPGDSLGTSALIVGDLGVSAIPGALISAFESFRPVGAFADPVNNNKHYFVYKGETLKHWPKLHYIAGTVE